MDSSDVTRRRKAQALYAVQLPVYIAKNPTGDCANLSTCCTTVSSCVRTFESYANKYSFYQGRNACQTGAAAIGDFSWGTSNCLYPVTGGNK
jgi:hypothetical protein